MTATNNQSLDEVLERRAGTDQRIWLDKIADKLGFGYVVSKLSLPISSAMLFVTTVVFVDTILFEVIRYFINGRFVLLRNPFVILGEGGGALLIVVFSIRSLNDKYDNAKIRLQIENRLESSKVEQLKRLGSDRWRWIGWIVIGGIQILQATLLLGPAEIYRVDGFVGLLGNFVFIPFVYVPVVVDFAITYIAIQFWVPRYIRKSGLSLDFLDPENMGGLRPIGELLKQSYYVFVLLYISAALFIYGPELFPNFFYSPFSSGIWVNAAFTIIWIASIILITYGIFTLHIFMREEKKKELLRLDLRVKNEVEKPFDVQNFKIPDNDRYEEIRMRMEHVTATHEYPATFALWTQLLISILVPKAVQMLLDLA